MFGTKRWFGKAMYQKMEEQAKGVKNLGSDSKSCFVVSSLALKRGTI
jgi:hypothetical protein